MSENVEDVALELGEGTKESQAESGAQGKTPGVDTPQGE